MKKLFALLAVTLQPLSVIAQSDFEGEDEAVILSPFLVTTDKDSSYSTVSSPVTSAAELSKSSLNPAQQANGSHTD